MVGRSCVERKEIKKKSPLWICCDCNRLRTWIVAVSRSRRSELVMRMEVSKSHESCRHAYDRVASITLPLLSRRKGAARDQSDPTIRQDLVQDLDRSQFGESNVIGNQADSAPCLLETPSSNPSTSTEACWIPC